MGTSVVKRRWTGPAAAIAWLGLLGAAGAQAPAIDPADDERHFGPPDNVLFWTWPQKVAGFRNYRKLFPARTILSGNEPLALPTETREIGSIEFEFEGRTLTVDDYFAETSVAGLLVLQNGKIAYERYGLGNTEETLWVSYSVAKSVTSLLVGAALEDGYIDSLDEKVTDYLPRLKGSSYEQASIRNVMQMSSGVAWNEDYDDPDSDVNLGNWETLYLFDYLRAKPIMAAPGALFNYNTAETNLVGSLLRAAIGNNLSTYLSEKIWRPFGMEADAAWTLTEPGGGEFGGCCINATLRDYGRLGLFAMGGGMLADGTRVLPAGWMEESTTPAPTNDGYGYLWWLEEDTAYTASGIFGQRIYINPAEQLVIAQHAARETASRDEDWRLQDAFEAAVAAALKD